MSQTELNQTETALIALVDGVQAESVSCGEEHNQGPRFKALFDRRETLVQRGYVSSTLTDSVFLTKLDTRISEYVSGDDAESVTISEDTVRNVRMTHLQQALQVIETRTPTESAGVGTPFHYYEPCSESEDCGSSSFFNVEAGY